MVYLARRFKLNPRLPLGLKSKCPDLMASFLIDRQQATNPLTKLTRRQATNPVTRPLERRQKCTQLIIPEGTAIIPIILQHEVSRAISLNGPSLRHRRTYLAAESLGVLTHHAARALTAGPAGS